MTTPAGDTPTDPTAGAAADQTAAPAADTSTTAVRDLATVMDTPPPTTASFIKGVVTAVALTAAPPTCSIQVSGDTTTTVNNVRMNDAYTPVIGDTCIIGKQDTNIFVICQLNDSGTGSANGWITPALSTNVTTNGNTNGPLQYRVVVDGGDLKVQFRGSVAIAAGATALFSVAGNAIPSAQRNIMAARDVNGSTISVQVQIAASGAVTLSGSALSATTNSGGPAGTATGTSSTHNHAIFYALNGYLSQAGSNLMHSHDGGGGTDGGGGATDVGGAHTHTIPTGTHTHTITIPAATWVSFNGIEYFV